MCSFQAGLVFLRTLSVALRLSRLSSLLSGCHRCGDELELELRQGAKATVVTVFGQARVLHM